MSVRDDLLNDKEAVMNEIEREALEHIQMCSYQQDELEEMCSSWQDDTCRSCSPAAKKGCFTKMIGEIRLEKWKDITETTLKDLYYEQNLSDSSIAELYGVTKDKVRYKRNKFGITLKNKIYNDFVSQNGELFDRLNNDSKSRILKPENIDGIAKALTHYAFRNGPVEDMHADGKLTQKDMKTLNKYMVNRLAGILTAVYEGRWLQLELLYGFLQNYGTDWDKAEPDNKELDLIWKESISLLK